jgi:hypothetical protein
LQKDNESIGIRKIELKEILGTVEESLQDAERQLESAKDKLTKDIKLHVAEVRS